MTAGTFFLVLTQLLVCSVVAWAAGRLLLAWLEPRIEVSTAERFGVPERALVSAVAFIGLSVVLMVAHLVTGGSVFGVAPIVPIVGLVLVGVVLRSRGLPKGRVPSRGRWALAVFALTLVVLYAVPVVLTGSGVRTGDPPWHLGWTEQLLAGEPVPTGPAPEFGRNAYPWGFHGVLATMVRLVPGSDPLIAHETMHLLLIGLIPLAAACLARLVNRRAGLAAAWLASLVGGFAWLADDAELIASPSEARFGADLVVASPNSMYELFPPALPREVALVALGAATLLLATALRARDTRLLAVAGAAMGAVGLISVPMLLNATAWSLFMCLFMIDEHRWRSVLVVAASAIGVFALWAGPVIADHLRFDGFVNITPQLGVEWDLGVALASWGVLLPLAVGGAIVLLMQPPIVNRPLLACLLGSVGLFVLALARARLDWGLFGNETLLHQGRMWPPLHLVGAALGGLGLLVAYGWLRARARALGAVMAAGVAVLGLASPVVASTSITKILSSHTEGFDYAEPDLAKDAFVRRAADHLGPDDVVEVQGSDEIAFLLFQFSGTKLATYDDPRLVGNELRIRFSDLAARWDARMSTGGFEPDYVVRRVEGSQQSLERGTFHDEEWELVEADA